MNAEPAAKTLYTPKMADYVVDFIKTAKLDYGLDIGVTGIWNEKVYDVNYVKELHRKLQQEHLATKIICCDEYPGEGAGQWAIADDILKDPELAADIDVIGVHYPLEHGKLTTTDSARRTDKPLWSSEDQPNGGVGRLSTAIGLSAGAFLPISITAIISRGLLRPPRYGVPSPRITTFWPRPIPD